MPVFYVQEQVMFNENGIPESMRYINANILFKELFCSKQKQEQVNSSMFPHQTEEYFMQFARIVFKKEGRLYSPTILKSRTPSMK